MPKRKTTNKQFLELCKDIDIESFRESVKADFTHFPDPRKSGQIVYPAWYLMLVILCGYFSNCDTLADIAHFAEARENWLKELTGIPYPPPSYDTFWWFLVRVKPEAFKEMLKRWFNQLPGQLRDQLLVIDGKRLRGASTSKEIVHIVEFFAAKNCLVIAQERVPEKTTEPKALPELLKNVNIEGALVSMDALFTTVNIAKQILKEKADYLFGLKGNQGSLHDELINFFVQAHDANYEGVEHDCYIDEIGKKQHGRFERRTIRVVDDIGWLPQKDTWDHLSTLIEVRSEREINENLEEATRYYISSRKGSAKEFSEWIRDHWGIENKLHWVADVVFREDDCLMNVGYAAENLSLIRRIVMNIVHVVDPECGLADARRNALFEPHYLRGALGKIFIK